MLRRGSAAIITVAAALLAFVVLLVRHEKEEGMGISTLAWAGWDDGERGFVRTEKLGYWPTTGICDGMRPDSQQSPIAIEEAQGGNVREEVLPSWGWVGNTRGGLFRMKTPGTRQDTGAPGQTIFVKGNVFDMSEVGIDMHYDGAKYKLVNFKLKTPSEHTINGQRFAMEQQFMHTLVPEEAKEGDVEGQEEEKILPKTLMVSVMFSSDPLSSANYVENNFLHRLFHGINCMREGMECHQTISFANMARTILFQTREAAQWWKVTYDFNWLDSCLTPPCAYGGRFGDHTIPLYLPPGTKANLNHYFRYQGSMTDPPCTEGVEWIVLKNALPIAQDHAEEFQHVLIVTQQIKPLISGLCRRFSTHHFEPTPIF